MERISCSGEHYILIYHCLRAPLLFAANECFVDVSLSPVDLLGNSLGETISRVYIRCNSASDDK